MHGRRKDLAGLRFNRWTVLGDPRSLKVKGGQTKLNWLCRCDCGTERHVYQNSLTSGKSQSCGCIKIRLTYKQAMVNELYKVYSSKCKRQGIVFEATRVQFESLMDANCYYCGDGPSNVMSRSYRAKRQGAYAYNGIDRVDNEKGYIAGNMVTACKNCNLAKRSLTKEQFFDMIRKISKRHGLNEE